MAFICAVTASFASCGKHITKYISSDCSEVFTFVGNDSLYIDTYESGCGIAAYKLTRISENKWKGTCLDYTELDEEPKLVTETISIRKTHGRDYKITFNGNETYRIKLIEN